MTYVRDFLNPGYIKNSETKVLVYTSVGFVLYNLFL